MVVLQCPAVYQDNGKYLFEWNDAVNDTPLLIPVVKEHFASIASSEPNMLIDFKYENYNDRNPILLHGFSLLGAILRKKRTPKRKPAGHHQALAAKKINLITTVLRPFPALLGAYFQTPVCNINMNCFILCFAAARYLSCFLKIFFLFCLSRLWTKQRVRLLLWLLEYRTKPLLLILSQTLL